MSRFRQSPTVLAVSALLVVLIAAAWVLLQEPPALQVRRLPDGSEIRLEAVTVGQRHRFAEGSRWRRLLSRLEERIRPAAPGFGNSSGDSICFWTTRPASTGPSGDMRVVFFDEHGCEYQGYGFIPWFDAGGPRVLDGWPTPIVPRRAKWIGLRLLQRPGQSPPGAMAEFSVPNPAADSTPAWKPEPLPATRREGDLAVTLTALRYGLAEPGPSLDPAKRPTRGWMRASFRVAEAGRSSADWAPVTLTMSDASSNEIGAWPLTWYHANGQTHLAFGGGLCREEPAWKLRVGFERKRGFPAGDLWTARGVPITRQGTLPRYGEKTRRHGATVELYGVAGIGVHVPALGVTPRAWPLVALQVTRLATDVRLMLLRATDQRGRAIDWKPYQAGSDAWSRNYAFSLKARDETKAVDLTLAVSRHHVVEFAAKPSRM